MATTLPHNSDAEKAILGGILTYHDAVADAAADLSPGDFYSTAHGAVWGAFLNLHKNGVKKIDVVTLLEASNNVLTVDQLLDYQINSAVFSRKQVELVIKHAAAREMIAESNNIVRDLIDGADPYESAVEMERFVSRLGTASTAVEQEALTILELSDNAEAIAPVVIPGLCNRDYRTVVVAEEGAGKSLLLRVIAQSTAQGVHPFSHRNIEPKRTLVVDLENPAQAILDTSMDFEMLMMERSLDYDPERFRIWRKPGGINIRRLADRAALQREIAYHRPELVCIGPIYKMYARTSGESYEDSADDAMRVLDELRTKYEFALYMEHHAAKGKSGEGRDLAPMGSQRWMAWPEIGISLYKDKVDPTSFDVKRFRGDRLSGVRWPDRIVRDRTYLVDGVWEGGLNNAH
jgi:replicative DNA helicase